MSTIGLTFRPEIPRARREAVLETARRIPGVVRVSLLKPESEHPEISRIAYLALAAQADVDAVLRRLRELPEVEAASLQAERRLL